MILADSRQSESRPGRESEIAPTKYFGVNNQYFTYPIRNGYMPAYVDVTVAPVVQL